MTPRATRHFVTIAIALVLAGDASAKDPERIPAADGQTIVKKFHDDGIIKTLTRIDADGSLIAIQYYTTKGTPTHADYFDYQNRVRRRVFYYPDGSTKNAKEFDEHGKVVLEQELDRKGYVVSSHAPK